MARKFIRQCFIFFAKICRHKFPLVSMWGWVVGQLCTDLGARTPTAARGNWIQVLLKRCLNLPRFYDSCKSCSRIALVWIRWMGTGEISLSTTNWSILTCGMLVECDEEIKSLFQWKEINHDIHCASQHFLQCLAQRKESSYRKAKEGYKIYLNQYFRCNIQ